MEGRAGEARRRGTEALSRTGGPKSPEPPDGFFPTADNELKRLATARLAGERAGHSLDAAAPVHEAHLRLDAASIADRNGFFLAAAVAMPRILGDGGATRGLPAG